MKINWNSVKNVVITVLITANIAFIGGIVYNQKATEDVNARIDAAVQAKAESLKAEAAQPANK